MGPAASSVHHTWVSVAEVVGIFIIAFIAIVVVGNLLDRGADALRWWLLQRGRRRAENSERRSWWRRLFGA
jgi:hypothetical protein